MQICLWPAFICISHTIPTKNNTNLGLAACFQTNTLSVLGDTGEGERHIARKYRRFGGVKFILDRHNRPTLFNFPIPKPYIFSKKFAQIITNLFRDARHIFVINKFYCYYILRHAFCQLVLICLQCFYFLFFNCNRLDK